MKILIAVFLAFAVLCSCSDNSHADPVLDRADTLMYAAPDSAVAMLDSLSGLRLSTDRRARLALLLAKAHEKAGTVAADSASLAAITAAADYYRGRGDSLDVQSQFYRGVLNNHLGNTSGALTALMEAADRASALGDNFYLAMAYREQAAIYAVVREFATSTELGRLAVEHFNACQHPVHAVWEKLFLIQSLTYYGNLDEAAAAIDQLATDSLIINDVNLRTLFNNVAVNLCFERADYADAEHHFNAMLADNAPITSTMWSRAAVIEQELGKDAEAFEMYDHAIATARYPSDSIAAMMSLAKIKASGNDYRLAYNLLSMADKKLNNVRNKMSTDHYSRAVIDHYHGISQDNQRLLEDSKQANMYLITIACILAMLCVVSYMLYRRHILSQKLAADVLMSDIRLLQEKLSNASSIIQQSGVHTDNNSELFQKQMIRLNSLCEFRHSMQPGDLGFKHLGKKASDLIDELGSEENLNGLEQLINLTNDNLMVRFRSQVPDLTPRQYSIVLLTFAGFSSSSITTIFGYKSDGSLRNNRYKIRLLIKDADSVDKEYFLSLLG